MKFTRETLKRAIRTALQAMIAYLIITLPTVDYNADKEALKAVLIGVFMSTVAAGLSAVMNLEQKGSCGMDFDAWVKAYLGRKTDFDGAYGVQCVDLVDCYIVKCLGLAKGFWGNAKYWWLNRNSSKWLKDNFTFITPEYKNGELKKGDIGIRTSGAYGHIFVIAEPAKKGKIKYYDQNATGNGDKMTLREVPYTSDYITGILRPKNRSNIKDTIPSYKVGSTYKLTADLKVRKGAGTGYAQKKRSELTANAKANALTGTYAVLKSGTKITVQEVKKSGSDIWLRIPSGWIAAYYNGKKYIK